MKKIICMVLLLVVLFTITACGNSREEENPDGKPEINTSEIMQSDTGSEEAQEAETETAQKSGVQTEIQSTESAQENTEQEVTEMKMKVQVGDITFTATLAENSSVDSLKELMANGPLTLNMSDYAGMEKSAELGVTLPQNNEQMNTRAGDIILYQGRTFVIYYDTNSWSLTPIGKIDNVDAEELREALGTGDVTVILSIE
ncbi:MAG: hypothetical protein HDR03_10495 [Lachnospiraceae bacterium]|nr:hypothetical protein [Lachnospiraceae bacterium]